MIRWLWNQMMKWGWDFNRNLREQNQPIASRTSTATPVIRIGLVKGINGRMLEVATPRAKNGQLIYSDDWDYEFFMIRDDQLVSEAVAMVMLLKGLDK